MIRAMFQQSWNIHKSYGITPLRSYLESERITLPELKELVQKLGSAVRKPFKVALQDYSREIKKAPPEYYDDFYYFRGRIFRPLDKIFAKFDPAEMPIRQLKRFVFNTKKIDVDVEDRPKKTPSELALFVQIPNDAMFIVKQL